MKTTILTLAALKMWRRGVIRVANARLLWLAGLAGCILMAVSACGCSAIGYKIGKAVDNDRPDSRTEKAWDWGKEQRGKPATVFLNDGTRLQGSCDGLSKLSEEDYSKSYTEFMEELSAGMALPQVGDTIRIFERAGYNSRYEFRGFDFRRRSWPHSGSSGSSTTHTYLMAKSIRDGKDKEYPLDTVGKIMGCDGKVAKGADLIDLSRERSLPLRTALAFKTAETDTTFRLSEVNRFEIPRKKYAGWIALGLGIAADAAILTVVAVAAFTDQWSWPSPM